VFSSAGEILSTSFSSASAGGHAALENTLIALPWAIVAAAILQMMLYAIFILICARKMAAKSPLHLLRK
jgi:ABC-type antimicrobial peptide transport system permease subunit